MITIIIIVTIVTILTIIIIVITIKDVKTDVKKNRSNNSVGASSKANKFDWATQRQKEKERRIHCLKGWAWPNDSSPCRGTPLHCDTRSGVSV